MNESPELIALRRAASRILSAAAVVPNGSVSSALLTEMLDDAVRESCEPIAALEAGRSGEANREADRQLFAHPDFNRWMDDVIDDCGHTVWHAIPSVEAAWAGWSAREHYAAPPHQPPPVGVTARELFADALERHDYHHGAAAIREGQGGAYDRAAIEAIEAALSHQQAAPSVSVVPDAPGNWPEDSSHENGDYECLCSQCGATFYGHKRRVVCKLCAKPAPVSEPAASGEGKDDHVCDADCDAALDKTFASVRDSEAYPRGRSDGCDDLSAASGAGELELLEYAVMMAQRRKQAGGRGQFALNLESLGEIAALIRRLTTTGQGDVERG